jgi:glutaredoxin 3
LMPPSHPHAHAARPQARDRLMQNPDSNQTRQATLYRMVLPDHECPFGLRARDMLEREGYEVDEHLLTSREQTDAFKAEHDVPTTPQVFIGGERIGDSDALEQWIARH